MFTAFISFLSSNLPILGAIGGIIAFLWAVLQFFFRMNMEKERIEYEKYDKLVYEFTNENTNITRKAAIAHELRHCNRQRDFILRMLKALIIELEENQDNFKRGALLIGEMKQTIAYIERCR